MQIGRFILVIAGDMIQMTVRIHDRYRQGGQLVRNVFHVGKSHTRIDQDGLLRPAQQEGIDGALAKTIDDTPALVVHADDFLFLIIIHREAPLNPS